MLLGFLSASLIAVLSALPVPAKAAAAGEPRPTSSPFATAAPARPTPESAEPLGSPFQLRLEVDIPILALTGLGALVPELLKGRLSGPSCLPGCRAEGVPALDRPATGYHSQGAGLASDILVAGAIALPFVLDLVSVLVRKPSDGMRGFAKDATVLAQVLSVESALAALAKFTVRRTRPLVYDPAVSLAERSNPDNTLSFFSAHSGAAFAAAVAGSWLFARRHPRSPWRWVVWAGSLALAAVTASLRVAAGKHFFTDVLTGAGVGSAVGFLVPYLHRLGDAP
jgi:membrane-associated phospholipid phosphatase